MFAFKFANAPSTWAGRANAELPYMGMTSYDKKNPVRITRQEAAIAKNYLTRMR